VADEKMSLAEGFARRHKPIAEEETHVLLLEPQGTLNTGDAETVGTTGVPLR